jgi:hypothetical protein
MIDRGLISNATTSYQRYNANKSSTAAATATVTTETLRKSAVTVQTQTVLPSSRTSSPPVNQLHQQMSQQTQTPILQMATLQQHQHQQPTHQSNNHSQPRTTNSVTVFVIKTVLPDD